MSTRKVLLMILDGWGIGHKDRADVIGTTPTPHLTQLTQTFPHAQLRTDGEHVGLPNGQMGNSEVGHINIGAGRVVYQDLVRINRACEQGTLGENDQVRNAFDAAKAPGATLHLMGLFSSGGVHALDAHFVAMIKAAKDAGVTDIALHLFTDGRDTDPMSGVGFVKALEAQLKELGAGRIASVIGRYWAMDRDRRWERVKRAYDLLTQGVGTPATVASIAMQTQYDAGTTDEFMEPIVMTENGAPVALVKANDTVIFMNFRNDRAKELTTMLAREAIAEVDTTPLALNFYSMTPYDATFTDVKVLFDKENVQDTLGEVVAKAGLKQLRIAETEKYPHVTFFLNGGQETPYTGEDRILVPSPKVATYDLQPEMSAPAVTEKLVDALKAQTYDFICLNFANGDMVGHTGKRDAIVEAVKVIDDCAGRVIAEAQRQGYDVIQIADHGNADHAENADGSPNTAHSLNPVPILVVSDRVETVTSGVLADVAPTVLTLMGLPIPEAMTGRVLVTLK